MPYQYKGATARSKSLEAVWSTVDLSTTDLNTIFQTYSRVFLTIEHSIVSGDVYLDLHSARNMIPPYTGTLTVSQWLLALGNTALPTTTTLPTRTPKPVLYSEAFRAGYKIEPVDRTRHPEAQLPYGDKNDLLMKRAGVDFRAWGRFCLVTVNGFYHRCFGSLDGLYVVEGGRTGRVMNNDHVGVHSFREVGALDLIPITPEMLYKTHPNQKFSEGVNIRLPYDTEGKTVLLSIGGYLHVLDRAYRVTGSRSVKIDMANLAYVNRIYESLGKIDLSSLNLENSPNNSEQFVVAQLLSDEVISAYLCLPQSYVIVLDATDIYVRRHQLERTGLPGRYIAPMPFKPFPMISECGRVFEYRAFPEDHRMLIASETAREERLTFTTTGWQANLSVDPTVYQGVPWRIAAAEMLEFGTFG